MSSALFWSKNLTSRNIAKSLSYIQNVLKTHKIHYMILFQQVWKDLKKLSFLIWKAFLHVFSPFSRKYAKSHEKRITLTKNSNFKKSCKTTHIYTKCVKYMETALIWPKKLTSKNHAKSLSFTIISEKSLNMKQNTT